MSFLGDAGSPPRYDAGMQGLKEHLQEELLARMRKNPRYSLRAMARSLTLEPSALSKVLSGKRRITPGVFQRIASRLPLAPAEVARFAPRPQPKSLTAFTPLSQDLFEVLTDWYHYAILELTHVEGFRPSIDWIAKRLGLKSLEARLAVDRLERLGMLKDWKDCSANVTTVRASEYTNAALRAFQKRLLEQAIDALERVDIRRRDHSAVTMAVSTARLPEAKRQIRTFRRKLNHLLQSGGPLDEVYTLTVSLFPVSRPYTKERKLP